MVVVGGGGGRGEGAGRDVVVEWVWTGRLTNRFTQDFCLLTHLSTHSLTHLGGARLGRDGRGPLSPTRRQTCPAHEHAHALRAIYLLTTHGISLAHQPIDDPVSGASVNECQIWRENMGCMPVGGRAEREHAPVRVQV